MSHPLFQVLPLMGTESSPDAVAFIALKSEAQAFIGNGAPAAHPDRVRVGWRCRGFERLPLPVELFGAPARARTTAPPILVVAYQREDRWIDEYSKSPMEVIVANDGVRITPCDRQFQDR